jgi:Fur family ferric uptake transcriptional regulator
MEVEGLFDADSLLLRLRGEGKDVSKATVYRTLRLLQDAGIITPFMLLDAKVTHYQLVYGRDPSDYIVCVKTGRFEPLDCGDVVGLRDSIATSMGWKTVGHRFVIYGVSPGAASDDSRD